MWRARLAADDMGGLLDDGVAERSWFGASLSFFTWYFHLHLRKDTYEECLLILTTLQEPLLCMRASAQLQFLGTICYLVAACDARTHAVAAGIRRI